MWYFGSFFALPVSAAAEKNGLKFLLWIEPERVRVGTWLDRERPKWVLKTLQHMTTGLLNLGNKDARRWLTDTISGLIDEGISVYRQDFNMDPIDYWKFADKKTRQGITEIRHVEGLYEFWDELLRRRPGLLIDNCASGGRRLDLETVSRSMALWRTDYGLPILGLFPVRTGRLPVADVRTQPLASHDEHRN